MMTNILSENRAYWTQRAPGYSAVNRQELATDQRSVWRQTIAKRIHARYPQRAPGEVRVLEIGTGPGFFAILLAEAGYDVTAVDLTPAMLAEARRNAGPLAEKIRFLEMNAEALDFPGDSFDVILSRNLTWNLPHPETAYAEWHRVLRPGGLLLNFDANWYGYLFDASAQAAYAADRAEAAARGIEDQNVGEHFDVMEGIARRVPLSNTARPSWDLRVLTTLGLRAEADETIWQTVWSEEEKISFASTPLFLVNAVKG